MNELEKTKNILLEQIKVNYPYYFNKAFLDCQKFYFWSNENINGYLNLVDINLEKALSVCASGDQVFNLITRGVLNIDTFDVNKLTEYYVLGIKRALIRKYSYQEFLNIVNILAKSSTSNNEITNILRELIPYMDEKYRLFWHNILEYNYTLQKRYQTDINIFYLLGMNIQDVSSIKNMNNYLKDENSYNILKNNLEKSHITFKEGDAHNLSELFNDEYDIILLSNILDYFYLSWHHGWNYTKLKEYFHSLEKICHKDTYIFFEYIFLYMANRDKLKRKILIMHSTITNEDLEDEIVTDIPNPKSKTISDGIIYKRIK